jgi:hypothetical protein
MYGFMLHFMSYESESSKMMVRLHVISMDLDSFVKQRRNRFGGTDHSLYLKPKYVILQISSFVESFSCCFIQPSAMPEETNVRQTMKIMSMNYKFLVKVKALLFKLLESCTTDRYALMYKYA